MKSFPLLQAVLFLGIWLCLLPAMLHLTGTNEASTREGASDPAELADAIPADTSPAWLNIRCSHLPEKMDLRYEGITIYSNRTLRGESELALPSDRRNVRLLLTGKWPASAAAVELELEPFGTSPVSKTVWVSGSVHQEVVLSW